MAINLSKNKIDKLIALLDSSNESSDLDEDEIDEKPIIDDDENISIKDEKFSEHSFEEVSIKDEKFSEQENEESEPFNDNKKCSTEDQHTVKHDINKNIDESDEKFKDEKVDCIENEITVVKLEHKPIEVEDSSGSEIEEDSSTDDSNDPLNIKIGDKELNLDLLYPEQETKTETDIVNKQNETFVLVNNKKNNLKEDKKPSVSFKKKKSRIPLEKRVRCKICKAQRKNEEYLDLHMQTHEGKSEFECHVCGKFFSTTASVVRHQSLHEAAYKHQCEKCGKRFIFSSSLYSHKARHDDSRPFSCTVCGQTFKATKHLKRHMFIHTGERPFVCTVCGKAYSMKYMLKSHFKVHTRERHVCKLCEKSFKRQNDFERHMEWHVTGLANKRTQKSRKPKKTRSTEILPTAPSGDVINSNVDNSHIRESSQIVAAIPLQIPLFSRFNNT